MKLYYKILFLTAMVLAIVGSLILASGRSYLIFPDNHVVAPSDSYLPFFKLALASFVVSVIVKVYYDFTQRRKSLNS